MHTQGAVAADRRQLDWLTPAERARERGLDAVEASNITWVQRMRREGVRLSNLHGSVTTDDLQAYAARNRDNPVHQNAWGSVFRGKGWTVIDRVRSRRKSAHAREIKVWQWWPEPTS